MMKGLQFRSSGVLRKLKYSLAIIVPRSTVAWNVDIWLAFSNEQNVYLNRQTELFSNQSMYGEPKGRQWEMFLHPGNPCSCS